MSYFSGFVSSLSQIFLVVRETSYSSKNILFASSQSALNRLLVVAENYPELKANENFLDLQAQLEGTENRIAEARRIFNEKAQKYNKKVRFFPSNIIASMFGFKTKGYFEADAGTDVVPKVAF